MKIDIVGGPANGHQIDRPRASTVIVPELISGQYRQFKYTLRCCRDSQGQTVEVLAPAGRQIDAKWLADRGLKN